MYAWQASTAAQPTAQPPTTAAYPLQALSTSLPLPPPPPSNPLPPAPPAADAHGARVKLVFDKVRLEVAAVKAALDQVKQLSEGIEGLREDLRLMRMERDAKDVNLEKRIFSTVSDLLTSHFSSFSSSLDKATTTIVDTVRTHSRRVEVRVEGVEEALDAQGEKVEAVEKGLKEVKAGVESLGKRAEERKKDVMEKLKGLSEAYEAQVRAVEGWGGTIEGVEGRIAAVEEALKKSNSAAQPASTTFPSLSNLRLPGPSSSPPHSTSTALKRPPLSHGPASSDPSVAADSPPRLRPSRCTLSSPPADLQGTLSRLFAQELLRLSTGETG